MRGIFVFAFINGAEFILFFQNITRNSSTLLQNDYSRRRHVTLAYLTGHIGHKLQTFTSQRTVIHKLLWGLPDAGIKDIHRHFCRNFVTMKQRILTSLKMKEENEETPITGQGTWIGQKNFNF